MGDLVYSDLKKVASSIEWGVAGPLLAGSALFALGIQKRSALGWTLAALGGGVAASPFINRSLSEDSNNVEWVKRCITVNASTEYLYDFWSKPGNLVKIFPGVASIEPQPDGRWLWRLTPKAGQELTFRTENVTTSRPHFMHWRTAPDERVDHHGKVEFRPAPADRGSEIELRLTWRPRSITIQALSALGLLGKAASWHGSEVLRRTKQIIETGELSTASIGV